MLSLPITMPPKKEKCIEKQELVLLAGVIKDLKREKRHHTLTSSRNSQSEPNSYAANNNNATARENQ